MSKEVTLMVELIMICLLMAADPRTTDLLWLRTPEVALIAVAAYLLFVIIGPRWMEKREPLNLKPLIVVYNFAMVFMSAYMCAQVGLFMNLNTNGTLFSVCIDLMLFMKRLLIA
jgi:hypothetical protein